MPQLNARVRDLDMPLAIRSLPISAEGYPVPWFVAWMVDGKAQVCLILGSSIPVLWFRRTTSNAVGCAARNAACGAPS